MKFSPISLVLVTLLVTGCATTTSSVVETTEVRAAQTRYTGAKLPISIGSFDNKTAFMRGVFSDGVDRLGSQARTLLTGHLQQSQRFAVLDRENLTALAQESKLSKTTQQIKGAGLVLSGDVSEFGRKEVGDRQLFGILGRGKEQIAYSKVTINVINVITTEVVYSCQGAGEFKLSSREIIGFGGTASYDSTLNGKVLDLAIREAVDCLAKAVDSGQLEL